MIFTILEKLIFGFALISCVQLYNINTTVRIPREHITSKQRLIDDEIKGELSLDLKLNANDSFHNSTRKINTSSWNNIPNNNHDNKSTDNLLNLNFVPSSAAIIPTSDSTFNSTELNTIDNFNINFNSSHFNNIINVSNNESTYTPPNSFQKSNSNSQPSSNTMDGANSALSDVELTTYIAKSLHSTIVPSDSTNDIPARDTLSNVQVSSSGKLRNKSNVSRNHAMASILNSISSTNHNSSSNTFGSLKGIPTDTPTPHIIRLGITLIDSDAHPYGFHRVAPAIELAIDVVNQRLKQWAYIDTIEGTGVNANGSGNHAKNPYYYLLPVFRRYGPNCDASQAPG